MMKKLTTILFIFLFYVNLSAQNKNLEFNRVIDTLISVEVTVCTDLYSNPVYGSDLIVPNGKVWKIESLGSDGVKNASGNSGEFQKLNYVNPNYQCNGVQSLQNECIGQLIKKNPSSDEYVLIDQETFQLTFPLWLNGGSILKAKIFSNYSNYHYTWSNYLPYSYSCHASILEFNISQ